MDLAKLTETLRNAGVVGAGGAGFPSYAKLNKTADTIILNCAECEPLLKLHRQVMRDYAQEIMTALEMIAEAIEVSRIIIAIKPSYEEAVCAVRELLPSFQHIEIGLLPETYPAGDEVITIYETTGRVVPPGNIPIAVGVIVYNVETVLNVYRAVYEGKPVTTKFVTVAGEVRNPVTLEVPLGITAEELVSLAGGVTSDRVVYLSGGPMTGELVPPSCAVTKTTNAILVLPEDNFVVRKLRARVSMDFSRAKSVCCSCRMCTDLCPRHLLGHPISPAAFMTAAVNNAASNITPFLDTLYCSQCGLCEMYACFQDLSPRTLIGKYKAGLRQYGVARGDVTEAKPVSPARAFRAVPKERLTARLGLSAYDKAAPLTKTERAFKDVKIMLSQHIGAPCEPCVKVGDKVEAGTLIAKTPEGKLGVALHASVDGEITEITDSYIRIQQRIRTAM